MFYAFTILLPHVYHPRAKQANKWCPGVEKMSIDATSKQNLERSRHWTTSCRSFQWSHSHHCRLTIDLYVVVFVSFFCLLTVGAKKSFRTVLYCYHTLLYFYHILRMYALLSVYFRRTLIVLLPHPLMYCNCTTAVLSPYHTQP